MRILSCKLNQQEQQKNDEMFKMGYIRVSFLLLWYMPLPKPTVNERLYLVYNSISLCITEASQVRNTNQEVTWSHD